MEVKYDQNSARMHNKFFIVDGEVIGTGSFNWTKNADLENDENLLIVRSKDLATKYEAEFEEIWGGLGCLGGEDVGSVIGPFIKG